MIKSAYKQSEGWSPSAFLSLWPLKFSKNEKNPVFKGDNIMIVCMQKQTCSNMVRY